MLEIKLNEDLKVKLRNLSKSQTKGQINRKWSKKGKI